MISIFWNPGATAESPTSKDNFFPSRITDPTFTTGGVGDPAGCCNATTKSVSSNGAPLLNVAKSNAAGNSISIRPPKGIVSVFVNFKVWLAGVPAVLGLGSLTNVVILACPIVIIENINKNPNNKLMIFLALMSILLRCRSKLNGTSLF